MKRKAFAILLFTTLISTIFTSCNKDESENWNDGFITEELLKIPYLAKDSIHCYELWKVSDVNRLEFSKSRRGTGNLIWQNEFKIIDPITVDQGYGNTTIISDFYFRGFIDNDNYLCFLLAGALYHTVLSIYNLDGIFLFNHTVNVSSKTLPAGISRWTDGMLDRKSVV